MKMYAKHIPGNTDSADFQKQLDEALDEIDKQKFKVVDIKYCHIRSETRNVYSAIVMFHYDIAYHGSPK